MITFARLRTPARRCLISALCALAVGATFDAASAAQPMGLAARGASTQPHEAVTPPLPEGAAYYVLDDGTYEDSVGVTNQVTNNAAVWLNRFTPAAYPETILRVLILWPNSEDANRSLVGDPVTVLLYADPDGDGNPANAVLSYQQTFVIGVQDGTTFESYELTTPPTFPGAGDLYIGFRDDWNLGGATPANFPAALDQTTLQGRSWVAFNSTSGVDPNINSLGSNELVGRIDDFGLPGNWMIRAVGGCDLVCPPNLLVPTDPGQCSALLATPQATAEAGCGPVVCTPQAPAGRLPAPRGLDLYPLGTTTVVCQETAPGFSNCCVSNGGLGCDNSACENLVCAADSFCCNVAWDNICAGEAQSLCTGLCDLSSCCVPHGGIGCDEPDCEGTVCAIDSFCCEVAWDSICAGEAADLCGGLCDFGQAPASCSFDVTVQDVEAPVATAPDAVIGTDDGLCTAVYNYVPGYADNCPGGSTVCAPPSGFAFPLGDTLVSCTATDAGGLQGFDTGTVSVYDDEAPVIACPADQFATAPPGALSWPVSYPDPTFSDNCPGVTAGCAPPSGDPFPIGTTTVNCSALDGAGLTAACAFDVTVTTLSIVDIPTASTLGLMALALLLAGAAFVVLRRHG